MARVGLLLSIVALASACGHSATAPDHCQAEMDSQRQHRGAPDQVDVGATFQRWTYVTNPPPNLVVYFDWTSGHCVVTHP